MKFIVSERSNRRRHRLSELKNCLNAHNLHFIAFKNPQKISLEFSTIDFRRENCNILHFDFFLSLLTSLAMFLISKHCAIVEMLWAIENNTCYQNVKFFATW